MSEAPPDRPVPSPARSGECGTPATQYYERADTGECQETPDTVKDGDQSDSDVEIVGVDIIYTNQQGRACPYNDLDWPDRQPDSPHSPIASTSKALFPSPKKSATPEKSQMASPGGEYFEEYIPDIKDRRAGQPKLGQHTLSKAAIRQRANRIFTRRADGSPKVSEKIFAEWHRKGKERTTLENIFRQVGYDPELWSGFSSMFIVMLFAVSPSRRNRKT